MRKRFFSNAGDWFNQHIDILFLLAACLLVTATLRGQVSTLHKTWQREIWADERVILRPTRASQLPIIEALATGMKPLVADFYWIKAETLNADQLFELKKQSAAGETTGLMLQAGITRTPKDASELYDLLRTATRLDPGFEYAYFYGSTLLSWDGQVPLALSLLERGVENNPGSAMLNSSLSFLYFNFLGDWKTGAEYAKRSYEISGKYSAPPSMVTNLYAAGRNYDLAIEYLSGVRKTTTDPGTLAEIDNQLRLLVVEKHIEYLEETIEFFKKNAGFYPRDLKVLVELGIIKKIPKEPFGGKYVISAPGKVENKPRIRNDHYAEMRDYHKKAEEEKNKKEKLELP